MPLRCILKRYIPRQNDELVQLFLATQEQLESIDSKLQLVLEQLAEANSKRFGRSSEKMALDNQIAFMEVDGKIVFSMKRKPLRRLRSMTKINP